MKNLKDNSNTISVIEDSGNDDNKNELLQKEIEEIKKKMNDDEKEKNEIINNLKEETREAKFLLADTRYQSDIKIMKFKNIVKKLSQKLESFGVKVKDIK